MNIAKGSFVLVLMTIFLVGCITIPLGDGNKLKVSKEGVTFTDEDGGEHSITIDEEEEQVTMKGFGMEDEDDEVVLGADLDIPDALPKDIPIPDDANVHQASAVHSVITVSYTTTMNLDEIVILYEDYFSRDLFTEEPSITENKSGDSIIHNYDGKREDGVLAVQIDGSEDAEHTRVIIVFTENNDE